MRSLAIFLVIFSLAGCTGGGRSGYEEPLPRATYQKVNVASYAGAASSPSDAVATARGTRYQAGSISGAAADWSRWPAGTLFRVLVTGEIYEIDDFTDDLVGKNTILLYKPSALSNPSTRFVTIEIIKWGSYAASANWLRPQRSSTAKKILADLIARHPEAR